MQNPLTNLLNQRHYLVNDGAMGTELDRRGVDTNNSLWSALALTTDPDAVQTVHADYFAAGADIATTNTYQATPQGFAQQGIDHQVSSKIITEAVALAQAARDSATRSQERLVAGSVGPYGAFLADGSEYTGKYQLSPVQYHDFHLMRMRALAAAGVDLFAFETQPNNDEVTALVELLGQEFPDLTAWVSFSISDAHHLADGTPLARAAAALNDNPQIEAVGVNCTDMTMITPALRVLRRATEKPLIVYPNNGDTYNPSSKTWVANPHAASFTDLVPEWVTAGAAIIGGCCRTSPTDIATIRVAIDELE